MASFLPFYNIYTSYDSSELIKNPNCETSSQNTIIVTCVVMIYILPLKTGSFCIPKSLVFFGEIFLKQLFVKGTAYDTLYKGQGLE